MTQFVACFDFDGTLVTPKYGRFPKHKNDWKFYPVFQKIVKVFAELTQQNAIILIRSDQTKPFKQLMIDEVVACIQQQIFLDYSIVCTIHQVISRCKDTHKPDTILFEQFCEKNFINDISPSSFHVGDAAGREHDWSNVDLEFAHAAKLLFFTPEEYFEMNK